MYEKINHTDLHSKNSVERERTNCYFHYLPLTTVSPPNKYWYYKKDKPIKYVYINNGTDYMYIPYDNFLKEEERDEQRLRYLSNSNDTNSPALLRTIKSLFTFDPHCKNCTAEELTNIGLKSICCIALDYQRGEAPRVLAARLWRVVKIWTLVYLFIALPLWCMKGWCCCCLCCKFFRPRETIEEAKSYLLKNPPGVLAVNNKEIRYHPSESERDACEEFEHLLRTI
ncbi:uncharacterized protein LOC128677289 isoform X2 [Plodia interpunctella]|nr:uncharacterized protein LOC128677289 isoform X2 [Plodia interpunctella]